MTTRDLTAAQFAAALKRHGFEPVGFLGYFRLPGTRRYVSALNAGPRRRDQLAYLIRQRDRTPAESIDTEAAAP